VRTLTRSSILLIVFALVVAACGDDGSVLGADSSASTTAPSVTSEAPPATTEAPPATTEAPPATTEPPPATTEPPPATTEPPPATTEPPLPPVPILTPFDASETNADPPIIMNVVVPIVSGVAAPAADAMNGLIGGEMLGTATSFRDEILGYDPPQDPMGTSWELGLGYTGEAVTAQILSINFDIYMYYAGAAHGNSAVATMNFDPQTGVLLSLADILVPGTLPVMASIVEQRLVDDLYGGDAAEASGWIPVLDEAALDGWAVTPGGLSFSFDQYEVGFGAMGAPTVLVPWADLAAVIDSGGPAALHAFGP